ncbi:hypothetical protein G9A89_014650 [Geosiphon pyriformis]|nr:hypothetical protein G9A89_014650 [Geosiphon pyriformis]
MTDFVWKIVMCNVHGMNNLAKQDDVICWHKDISNLISIFTESKLKEKIYSWIANKFDGMWVFTFGLNFNYLGAGVTVVINNFLVKHVCKVSEVPGQLISIRLLFRNKLLVLILGLYAGASLAVRFSQAGNVNSLIAKAVNDLFFIIFGSNFNENRSRRYASYKKCFDLGLVNSLNGSFVVKAPTWSNFRGVLKTIDYLFISSNLVNAIVDHGVANVMNHFNTDHKAVSVSVSLGGLLDVHLILLYKQANKNHWKFDVKNVNGTKCSNFDVICSALAKARKLYCSSKLLESKRTEELSIKQVINKRMKSFELDKSHTIKCVLECPFHKVVLDYLVVGDELILEPDLVKPKVNEIIEGWTRKHRVVSDPLDYMFDGAFFGVMCPIGFDEMSAIVKKLLDEKAAELSGISNEFFGYVSGTFELLLVLTNTHPIALIKMACKIFSKVLLNRISSACSTFDVLHEDNFSVLKDIMTQSPIFAIGSVVEDVLEKNWELWLVLQNMRKAYNSVGWEHLRKSLVRIKIYDKFIKFFGSIHNGCVNRVMTNFSLTDGEVFLSLLWHIFYDSLLCEVKRQESVFGSSQTATQHIFNVASEFFRFNDISINNDKMVVIPINCQVANSYLIINDSPISIVKKKECYYYLGIFLLTEGLSRPSLVKVHLDVWFFANLVLKKVISDKQFVYLVSAVFFPIVCYRTQFSYILLSVCNKWNAIICKGLKSKTGFLLDFPNDTLHHSSLYSLRTFEQIQAESKSASIVSFVNSVGLLGHLFSHRSYDLQVFSWHHHYPLQFPVHIKVCPTNNFLAGVVHILSGCDLSFGGSFPSAFYFYGGSPMFLVLGKHCFFKYVSSLCCYGVAFVEQLYDWANAVFSWNTFKYWKRLDPRGPVSLWFNLSVQFLGGVVSSSSVCLPSVDGHALSDVL